MNGRITSASEALEVLVPPFDRVDLDGWDAIVARATMASPEPRRKLMTRKRGMVFAIAIAVIATLLATPAFGIRGLIADLFGRHNVPFTGKTAPVEVKRNFFDLGIGVGPSMAPNAIASQARRVASFVVRGKTRVLFVAPTRAGGYCWQLSGAFGGCRISRDQKPPAHTEQGSIHPERFGVTFEVSTVKGVDSVALVGGDIVAPDATSLTMMFADGTQLPLRFFFVSKPINAGFFYASIPKGHQTAKTRVVAAVLRARSGRVLARQPFRYETPSQRARRRAQIQAMIKRMKGRHVGPTITPSPRLPAPTPPFQRGQADGVSVVVGHNGVVVFDTSDATPGVRALISGHPVAYGCFRRLPYNAGPIDLTFPRMTASRVAIQLQGVMSPPFMGCDIQGGYGHLWPDRNGSHSAFEIAFTPAGERFLQDRAAARDLALFVRSRRMHVIRKENGAGLAQAIRQRYGARITRLSTATSSLPPERIGYVTKGATTTFVERSTTGRAFHVTVARGRIHDQNLKPLAFVF